MSASAPYRPRHESSDAHPRFVGLLGGALATLVAAGLLVGWGFSAAGEDKASTSRISSTFQEGQGARSGVDREWAKYERDVLAHLSGYAWVDRKAGIVTIPMDRAIDLVCADEARHAASPAEVHPAR